MQTPIRTHLAALALGATLLAPAGLAQAQRGISGLSGPLPPLGPGGGGTIAGGNSICGLVDYHGEANGRPVGVVHGPVDVTFGPSWIGVIDSDDGGTGNFANEPSPSVVATFFHDGDPIDLSAPVGFVEMWYSASAISIPLVVHGWDGPGGTGNIVATATGHVVGRASDGANCGGDPTGDFCKWAPLSIHSDAGDILSITIHGTTADSFGFEDMSFCPVDDVFEVFCTCENSGPCGNDASETGCVNSTGRGARLFHHGTPSVRIDDLALVVLDVPPNQWGVFLMADATQSAPFGAGKRCLAASGTPTYRFPMARTTPGGRARLDEGIVTYTHQHFGNHGSIEAGETWYYQFWYRDPAGPCSGTFNMSSALRVTFTL